MKVIILGSGTCASQLPHSPNRFPPGFLVDWDGNQVLFDCSEGVRFRLEQAGYNYADIKHIAISHPHPDHYALMHYVQSVFCHGLMGGSKAGELNVYAPAELIKDFPTLWNMYIPERKNEFFPYPKLNFKVAHESIYTIGTGALSAVKVYHGRGLVDAVAFRLETPHGVFVYSGDTGVCDGIKEIARGADVFICDASARVGDEKTPVEHGHLNPRIIGEISKAAGVKTVILTHYIGSDSDQAMVDDCKSSGFEGNVITAKDFQEIAV